MDLIRLGSRAGIALVAFAATPIAQAELPQLQPAQVLTPTASDIQPDPEQPPGEAAFGRDVVIKDNLGVVGLPTAHESAGLAAIFSRDASGSWIRVATLAAQDAAAGENFGKAVALSDRRVLVASTHALYVFAGIGSTWQQSQKVTFSAAVSDVAFAGKLAVIGTGEPASGENGAHAFRLGADGKLHGAVQILPSDVQTGDRFGAHVAISGSTVAITAPGYNSNQGATYVFTCIQIGCQQRQKLLANDGEPYDLFGASVDVLGNTLVVGASNADPVMGNDQEPEGEQNFTAFGAAYVFTRSANGTWIETQKLRVTPLENSWYFNLGYSVALSSNRLAIGAPYGSTRFEPGKLFVYQRMGTMYVATRQMIGALGLGHSVSLSGTTVLSGAPQESLYQGEADIYFVP